MCFGGHWGAYLLWFPNLLISKRVVHSFKKAYSQIVIFLFEIGSRHSSIDRSQSFPTPCTLPKHCKVASHLSTTFKKNDLMRETSVSHHVAKNYVSLSCGLFIDMYVNMEIEMQALKLKHYPQLDSRYRRCVYTLKTRCSHAKPLQRFLPRKTAATISY